MSLGKQYMDSMQDWGEVSLPDDDMRRVIDVSRTNTDGSGTYT